MSTQPFKRVYFPRNGFTGEEDETPAVASIIKQLGMLRHQEGGYFAETDRDFRRIPNPFHGADTSIDGDDTRSASTTIFYLLTAQNSFGAFHRNKARTVHTLHKGRGRYVVIHADEKDQFGQARVETFVVGQNIEEGEKLQWIVEGGKFKASFLLPDKDSDVSREGLLISEVGPYT